MSLQSLKLALGAIMNTPTPQTWRMRREVGDPLVVCEVSHFLHLCTIARTALLEQSREEEGLARDLKDLRARTVTRDDIERQNEERPPWEDVEGMSSAGAEIGRTHYSGKSNITEVPRPNTITDPHGSWVMPFSKKYKGEQLRDIPGGFLEWCLKQDWLREEAREHIEGELENRGLRRG